ncbi:MAG: cell envelope biogenesis protein TolA [Hyphomicrobiales bacterium]|nr:MAG: cell envelope biogenesis protein TolA [Hyphomicrobiales bacterium]
MRVGLVVSTVGHTVVLLWGLVALPQADPFAVPPVDALPVDLVTIAEITDLQRGIKTAEPKEQPSEARVETPPEPDATPEPVGPTDEPSPEPPAPEPTPSQQPATAEPPPATEPEPEPEPVREAAPEPPAPEPVPQAEPEPTPTPEPEPAPAEAAAEVAEPLPPSAIPRSKPTPPRPTKVAKADDRKDRQETANTEKKDFNPDKISALLNKTTPSGGGNQGNARPASLGSRTGNDNARMTQSELDALRAQISRCWNPPIGATSAEGLKVQLKVFLNRDGSVANPPKVLNSGSDPFFRAAADSARRAVLRCQPYQMPVEKFDAWNEINITFDPRELFGG